MKLVKMIAMPKYEIVLNHLDNGKYSIKYKISNQDFSSEEIYPFEMATILFDRKLEELRDVTTSKLS
jgi:hypothetical protein